MSNPDRRYRIRWTSIAKHDVTVDAKTLANLIGLPDLDGFDEAAAYYTGTPDESDLGDIVDNLAGLDDDGFTGLRRENIRITVDTTTPDEDLSTFTPPRPPGLTWISSGAEDRRFEDAVSNTFDGKFWQVGPDTDGSWFAILVDPAADDDVVLNTGPHTSQPAAKAAAERGEAGGTTSATEPPAEPPAEPPLPADMYPTWVRLRDFADHTYRAVAYKGHYWDGGEGRQYLNPMFTRAEVDRIAADLRRYATENPNSPCWSLHWSSEDPNVAVEVPPAADVDTHRSDEPVYPTYEGYYAIGADTWCWEAATPPASA